MKKIISILLAMVLAGFTTVTAFAWEEDLSEAKMNTHLMLRVYGEEFITGGYISAGYTNKLLWTRETSKEMTGAVCYVEDNVDNCTTVEEVNELRQMVYDCIEKMELEPEELKFILEFMERDYKSEGYYDDATAAEFKEIYEAAWDAYYSGDSDKIVTSFLMMENELNKFSLYNTTLGDVNMDGEFNVDDVTYMQKYLADMETMNNSQLYVCGITSRWDDSGIDRVTEWQKMLADMESRAYGSIKMYTRLLEECGTYDINKSKLEVFGRQSHIQSYLYSHAHSVYFKKYREEIYWK